MAIIGNDKADSLSPPRDRRGLSLVEAAISVVLVGGVMVAALNTLASAVRARQIQAERSFGTAVAQQLMTEIVQANYQEPESAIQTIETPGGELILDLPAELGLGVFGPEPSEVDGTRRYFDDVDDYDGWSASPPQAKDGTPLANMDGWTREVTVTYADPITLVPAGRVTDTSLKLITVTVTDPNGEETSLDALRSSLCTYDQSPAVQTTYVNWIGGNLQIGDNTTAAVESSVNLLNQPVRVED